MRASYSISVKTTGQPEFVSLANAKEHLKIDSSYEDALITELIAAAVASAENYLGWYIQQRDVVVKFSEFPLVYKVKHAPILNLDFTVTGTDVNDQVQDVSDSFDYFEYDDSPSTIECIDGSALPNLKDARDAVKITYVAGVDTGKLPRPIYQAILLIIGDMYEYRGDRQEINNTRAMQLMRPYRFWE